VRDGGSGVEGEHECADGLNRFAVMKRTAARQHFVENATQRKNVGARVLRAAHDLFRAPVSGRAEERAAAGCRGWRREPYRSRKAFTRPVPQVMRIFAGLHVAVDDAIAMRDAERTRRCRQSRRTRVETGPRLFPGCDSSGWTIHKFHDEVRNLRGFVDTHVVQGENARVRDLSDAARFLAKLLAGFASRDFRGNNLGLATMRPMNGSCARTDAAESASADGVEDFVTANFHGGLFQKWTESLAIVRIEKGNVGGNEAEVLLEGGPAVPGLCVCKSKKLLILARSVEVGG